MKVAPPASTIRRKMWAAAKVAGVFLWLGLVTTPLTYLMGFHETVFRISPTVAALFSVKRDQRETAGWQMVHILATDCPCSRAVADHLIERGVLAPVAELVILIGRDVQMEEKLTAAGFKVRGMVDKDFDPAEEILAAPCLFIQFPSGEVAYSGGYARRGASGAGRFAEVTIFEQLQGGADVERLPLIGCSIGARLRSQMDPLRLKYR